MEHITHLHDLIIKDGITKHAFELFKSLILDYYRTNGRTFAWRCTTNAYHIFISEVMLQQTQTHRVTEKYTLWCATFPDFRTLAHASFRDVLSCWQGLGYNRRALYIHKSAQRIVDEYGSNLPTDPNLLITLPGIGPNTAGSICAFAFNKPVIFIETNIRTVFIHCFFPGKTGISDKQLLPLIECTLDTQNPREWYYALMDFGVMLKKTYANPSHKSAHHTRQSKFEGSDRKIRGEILRLILKHQNMVHKKIVTHFYHEPAERIERILHELISDGLIINNNNNYLLT